MAQVTECNGHHQSPPQSNHRQLASKIIRKSSAIAIEVIRISKMWEIQAIKLAKRLRLRHARWLRRWRMMMSSVSFTICHIGMRMRWSTWGMSSWRHFAMPNIDIWVRLKFFCPVTFSNASHSTCFKLPIAKRAEFVAQTFELNSRTKKASEEWSQHATPITTRSQLSSSVSHSNTRTHAANGSPPSCHNSFEISPKAQPSSSVATTSWERKSSAAMNLLNNFLICEKKSFF